MSRVDLSGMVMGLLFMAIGAVYLLDRLGVWEVDSGVLWPAVLIGLGVAVLLGAALRGRA